MGAGHSCSHSLTFTITAEVAAGQGWIDTVEPVNPVPLGSTKHYRIHPARGWMISDVQIDGRSIGPSAYATIPFVQANHTIRAFFEPFDAIKSTDISTKLNRPVRVLLIGELFAIQRIAQYLDQLDDQGLIWIGFQGILKGNDLLVEYYSNRSGPASRNTMLRTITEGWDYVIPIDLFDYQSLSPELHLEGVRLIGNRAWFEGGQARLILPTLWTDNNSSQDQDSWQYDPNSEPDLAEKARYAQRVGYETIMQHGYLNINEPYDQSPSDLPVFNQHSIFYTPPKTFHAQDDFFVAWTGETLTVPESSIIANDPNIGGAALTINWQPRQATSGEFVLNEDGSFSYTPGGLDKGAIWLRYTLSDGATESNSAIIWIRILDSSVYTEKVHLPMLAR